ncbi:uncharacterized protein LOC101888819 [Musca domestica]|uniref:Uncharacterized protein LOC101888819 n=1 Tax=Musca domestica TaxID=7370 RepID=A0A1I8NAE2_MUSDO|nr:uncharacterized protein LOC101888819 [Musca domestica]
MTVVSNRQLYIYTIGLLIVWVIVLTTASSSAGGGNLRSLQLLEEDEKKNIKNCQALCEHCGCLNFYCGEECLCECNEENSNSKCILEMQKNARIKKMPFELLIQGPSLNEFVKNAWKYEERKFGGGHQGRNLVQRRRSTVTIYRPDVNSSVMSKTKLLSDIKIKGLGERTKREAGASQDENNSNHHQFEWFSDLTHNLVKPAPLGGRNRKQEELPPQRTEKPKVSKVSTGLDKSWFMDSIPNILTPAPLSKRLGGSLLGDTSSEDKNEQEMPGRTSKSTLFSQPQDNLKNLGKELANALGLRQQKIKEDNDDVEEDKNEPSKKNLSAQIFRRKLEEIGRERKNKEKEEEFRRKMAEFRNPKANRNPRRKEQQSLRSKLFKTIQEDDEQEEEEDDLVSGDNKEGEVGAEKPLEERQPLFRLPWWQPERFFRKVQYVLKT